MTSRFSLEGLRYAKAVTETGSFSAAARAYGVTQPALSNGVARLEQQLGAELFERSPRGVSPTDFGRQLLPLIDRALVALNEVSSEATRWHAPVSGEIRLGISPLVDRDLVARAQAAVQALPAPSTSRQLVLREANVAELRDSLAAGELDLLLMPSVNPLPQYEHRVVDSEPVVVVESSPTGGEPVELATLGDRQLILVTDACGLTTFTHDLFRSHDLPVHAYPGEAATYRALEEWAGLGLGTAVLPQSKLTTPQAAHRPLVEDGLEVEIFYEAVWDPASVLAPDLRLLAETLTSTAV